MATMAMQRRGGGGGYAQRSGSAGLYDVLDLLLDKGLVIDVFLRVSLIGIEILTVDARIVIASVDTYLRFAEAVNRLDLGTSEGATLPDLVEGATSGGAQSKTKGILEGAKESLFGSSEDDEQKEEKEDQEEKSGSGSGQRARSGQRSGSRQRPSSSSRGRKS
jgi:gas vesicle structural protein